MRGDETAGAVLFSGLEMPSVLGTVRVSEHALAVDFVVPELADIVLPVRPAIGAAAVSPVVQEPTFV